MKKLKLMFSNEKFRWWFIPPVLALCFSVLICGLTPNLTTIEVDGITYYPVSQVAYLILFLMSIMPSFFIALDTIKKEINKNA